MKYITLIIGLLVVGCGKQEQATTENPVKELTLGEKVVGTYEFKVNGETYRDVFLENGVVETYENGLFKPTDWLKKYEGKWSISKEGELHYIHWDGDIWVYIINKDGSITDIAKIRDGKREDTPKEEQYTGKKIITAVKELTAEEKKVVGEYEVGKDSVRVVLLENGIAQSYKNGKKEDDEGKWSISKEGELHIVNKDGVIVVLSINKDEGLTGIASIDKDGKREDFLKEDQQFVPTLKKIK
jgi:hypothetical protein